MRLKLRVENLFKGGNYLPQDEKTKQFFNLFGKESMSVEELNEVLTNLEISIHFDMLEDYPATGSVAIQAGNILTIYDRLKRKYFGWPTDNKGRVQDHDAPLISNSKNGVYQRYLDRLHMEAHGRRPYGTAKRK